MAQAKQEGICPFCNQKIIEGMPKEMTCPRCNIKYEFKSRGLFIGRFQPFHNGHLEVIKEALTEVDHLTIVIGTTQEFYTKDNPFTADEREEMIRIALDEADIKNYSIERAVDIPDDSKYVEHIRGIVPRFDIIYVATNQLNKNIFKDASFTVRMCHRFSGLEGRKIRQAIRDGREWESMVSHDVARYMKKIKGLARIKAVANKETPD